MIIIILCFRVGISKNKNIDHRGKKFVLCLVCQFKIKNSAIHASFPFFKLKEKDYIKRKIHSEKIVYMKNQCYYYFDLPKIRVGQVRTTKNLVAFA